MGDIADWLQSQEYDEAEDCEWGGRQPREPKCKRCGSTDVRWRQQGGKWVMFSLQPGVLHTCGGRAPAPASDFEPVE